MSAYIGLDVHKDWSFVTVLDQTGRVVVQKRLENEHVPSFLENFNVERIGLERARRHKRRDRNWRLYDFAVQGSF